MMKQFKQSLETSPLKALALLTSKSFVYNLRDEDLEHLAQMVEGNKKISCKIMVGIYSIIVLKKYPHYNEKKAIQNLLRQYRNKKEGEGKERMVIGGILLRMESFTHYSTIINDINPKVVGVETMLKHREKMKKQCPNKYNEMLDKYKNEWIQLVNDDQGKVRKLDLDLKQFRQKNEKMMGIENCFELYAEEESIRLFADYLQKRVNSLQNQDLHLQNITHEVNLLLSLTPPQSIFPHIQSKVQSILAFSQNFLYLFVADLSTKLKNLFFRQFQWLEGLLHNGITNLQHLIKLRNVIHLMKSLLIAFGQGGFDKESYVYSEPYSILKLMESILYNNYSQSEGSMNYQKKDKSKRNKKVTQISIYQANFVESHFEEYLHSISQIEREQLLSECILFIYELFKRETKLRRANQFLNLLINSKQELSFHNKCLFQKLKQLLLKEKGKHVGDAELLAEEAFQTMMRKKVKRQFSYGNTYSISILPEIKKRRSMNEELIKKTTSIDMVEGWNEFAQRGSQISSSICAPSDLFYTIKEHSSANQLGVSSGWKDGNIFKKELSVADENQEEDMIFTPDV